MEIKNIDDLRKFYYNDLEKVFYLEDGEKILKGITVAELKRLQGLISPIPVRSKKKIDILCLIKNYFDDEARTISLIRRW